MPIVTFVPIDPDGADREDLIAFMTANVFPFHLSPRPTRELVEELIEEGSYLDEDNASYWIDHESEGRIGFFRFEDLTEDTPLFDLRLDGAARGRGLASAVLRAATERMFTQMPNVNRFEGQTREDNEPMRRTFRGLGWVQEAYYREGWPVEGGGALASVAYSVLRRDWETGTTTPVVWDADAGPSAEKTPTI